MREGWWACKQGGCAGYPVHLMEEENEGLRRLLKETDPGAPLHGELAALLERHVRLGRRLDRIVKISDAFQSQLREAHVALRQAQEHLAEELKDAAGYVRDLLPRPMDAPIRVRWLYEPCAQLGGDALGYRLLPDGERVAFFVLDVCGHGLRSALLSISLLGALKKGGALDAVAHNPAATLGALNQMFPASDHGGLFTTIWYGVYDTFSSKLTYATAGHPPALLVAGPPGGRKAQELEGPGTFLGLQPDAAFTNVIRKIDEPSRLFVYSDGACEIETTGGVLGFEEFKAMLVEAVGDDDTLGAFSRAHAGARRGDQRADDCAMLDLSLGRGARVRA